jgi:hypothetical protein
LRNADLEQLVQEEQSVAASAAITAQLIDNIDDSTPDDDDSDGDDDLDRSQRTATPIPQAAALVELSQNDQGSASQSTTEFGPSSTAPTAAAASTTAHVVGPAATVALGKRLNDSTLVNIPKRARLSDVTPTAAVRPSIEHPEHTSVVSSTTISSTTVSTATSTTLPVATTVMTSTSITTVIEEEDNLSDIPDDEVRVNWLFGEKVGVAKY